MNVPKMLTFVEPREVIRALPVGPGDTVADFGAGSGHFSFEFARAVGSEGTVYALDVLPSALEAIASQSKTLGISNVIAQRCNLERANGSGLGMESVDWVIAKDVLLQNKDKGIIMREVARILKPAGRALIVEWDPDESIVGPEKSLRIRPDEMKRVIDEAGLTVVEEPSVGGFHYAFLVEKKH
ncbi:MAG: methyltransferase domain-containing protein [Candidatus Moraniibacteriota bacterium]